MESLFAALCAPSPWTGRTAATTAPKATALTGGRRGTFTCSPPTKNTPRTRGRQGHGRRPEPLPLRGPLCPPAGRPGPAGPGPHPDRPVLLDISCGEGYYSVKPLPNPGPGGSPPRLAGVDLSKHALRRAAKRVPDGEFAVASVYHLPVADRVADLLVDCFSPWPSRSFGGC